MDNSVIEIRDEKINVEEIMQKIQDNIRKRQAAGKFPSDPDIIMGSSLTTCCVNEAADAILRDIANVNTTWDMHNYNYSISSHHPFYGIFLVKGRQMVNEEVRRYIDPVISRQTNFNASIVRLLNNTKSKCTELDFKSSHLDEELSRIFSQQEEQLSRKFSEQELQLSRMISNQEEQFSRKFSEQELQLSRMISNQEEQFSQKFSEQELQLSRMISNQEEQFSQKFSEQELQLSRMISNQEEQFSHMISNQEEQLACRFSQQAAELNTNIREFIHSIFDDVFSQIDKDLANRLGLARILEERVLKGLAQTSTISESLPDQQTNYFLFEEHFRGSREDIKQRQIAFLPYFDKCTRVLDIGCGRGELLEILKSHNIGGMGVDLDADMVAYCNTRQLEVEQGDAVIYLEKLDDKSLDGIFIDQVVEHLEPSYLIRLLFLCHQKLKFGCYIVVETVNPLSFLSFVNFYIDLTHKRPIHPETLQYLMNIAGFRECKNIFFSPVSEDCKLKKITEISKQDEATLKNTQIYNHNIEILNTVLFGAQDYAVIGKK